MFGTDQLQWPKLMAYSISHSERRLSQSRTEARHSLQQRSQVSPARNKAGELGLDFAGNHLDAECAMVLPRGCTLGRAVAGPISGLNLSSIQQK